jgi:hypothetical protein
MKFGRFIGEKLHNLRSLVRKVAHGVHGVGSKLGGWILSAAAPVAAFNHVLGAGMAFATAIASGIGGLAAGGEGALNTGTVNLDSTKGHVGAMRSAYGQIRRPGSELVRLAFFSDLIL